MEAVSSFSESLDQMDAAKTSTLQRCMEHRLHAFMQWQDHLKLILNNWCIGKGASMVEPLLGRLRGFALMAVTVLSCNLGIGLATPAAKSPRFESVLLLQ